MSYVPSLSGPIGCHRRQEAPTVLSVTCAHISSPMYLFWRALRPSINSIHEIQKNPITLHLGLLPLKATLKGNRMVQNLCHVGARLKALDILDQITYASSWYSLLIVPVCRCAVVCSRWEEMEKDVHFGLTLPPVRVCPLWVDPSPAWTRTSFMDSPLNTK